MQEHTHLSSEPHGLEVYGVCTCDGRLTSSVPCFGCDLVVMESLEMCFLAIAFETIAHIATAIELSELSIFWCSGS